MLQRLSLVIFVVTIFACNYKKGENVSGSSSIDNLNKDSICGQYNATELIPNKFTYELQELFLKKKKRMYVEGYVSDIIYVDSNYWVTLTPEFFAYYAPNKTCQVKFQLDSISLNEFVANKSKEFGMIKGVCILNVKSIDFKNIQIGNEIEKNGSNQDVDYTSDYIANWSSVIVVRGELVKFLDIK